MKDAVSERNGILRATGQLITVVATVVLISCFSSRLNAENTKEYQCYTIEAEPVIDGRIEDEAWKKCPEAGGFFVLNGGYANVERQTFFRAFRNKDSIYLAVRCLEPAAAKIPTTAKDGDFLWNHDSIELFFIPSGAETYRQLIASAGGARWNARGEKEGQVSDWKAGAVIGTNEWTLEVKIPFAVLGKTPADNEQWKVSVARNILADPAVRHTCWTPLKKGFADEKRFGTFTFKTGTLDANALAEQEKALNNDYYTYMLTEIKTLNGKTGDYVETLEQAAKYPAFSGEAGALKSNWTWVNNIAGQAAPDFVTLFSGFGSCGNLVQRSNDLKLRFKLDRLLEE